MPTSIWKDEFHEFLIFIPRFPEGNGDSRSSSLQRIDAFRFRQHAARTAPFSVGLRCRDALISSGTSWAPFRAEPAPRPDIAALVGLLIRAKRQLCPTLR